jgi:uncharacterized protein YjbI with pentapeptide repeats
MANSKHLAILKKSVDEWNAWRRENPDIVPDLKGAYLRRRRLESLNLAKAWLFETNLRRAGLARANFRKAQLGGADLSGADLSRAVFREANLRGANFSRCNLRGTDFTQATFGLTVLGNVDLSETKGLETVRHVSPSTLGVDTLYRSGGNIPEVFMLGCGLPEPMIALAKSLVTKPPKYYSAFISYAQPDESFAHLLYEHLQKNGVRVWFAPEDIKIGETIEESVDQAIQVYDKLILILSKNSIDRAWVRHEFERAVAKEKREKQIVLYPIRLDDAVFETTEQWAYDLRKRHISDFGNWTNPLMYQHAINRLLRDLNAN